MELGCKEYCASGAERWILYVAMLLAKVFIPDTHTRPVRLKNHVDQCCHDQRVCRQTNQQWYLDGIRHIEAAALSVPDVQPSVAAAVVKQITQLLIVDL